MAFVTAAAFVEATAQIQPLAGELPYATCAAKQNKTKQNKTGVPFMVQWLTNPTRNRGFAGLIPGLAQWVGDLA